ncbi:sphingomyelin phosphodiesterase A-like [Gigantopelta aegis]|uniref:sphingomyelin phosphodiesterase A-like n=1 Tax=Gigantopelta aegis TaxID=1735272 RepID=UPI001B88741C|nr:sphingomyelin phosphodiesterase A-like [Gigantopelta aegis]
MVSFQDSQSTKKCDFPPHDIWQETWASQLNRAHDTLVHMREKLPGFNIYPTLGNHECFPESLYYQPRADYKNLNMKTSEWWQLLFPIPPDQLENIQYSLYYTVLVKPGLRILSFNSDYGYTINFYALLNHKTPAYYEQMKFMEETLHDARENNEKVILIGHVPPGDIGNTFLEYGDFFTDLVSAYSDVIVLTTFGHTHFDHFELVISTVKYW